MKKIVSISTAVILFGALFLTSCRKTEDPAPATTSTNNGFAGTWHNSEISILNGANTYPVTIEAPSTSTISFAYLYGFSTKVNATVINNSFSIPTDTIEGSIVSGSGVLANSNQINMEYTVNDGLYIDTVTATLTR